MMRKSQIPTVQTGRRAEQAAADYLAARGYEILEQNYRRRHCEIDVVARRGGAVFFVEVKYRADDHFGGGFDYIMRGKLHHMVRAAETWVAERRWTGEYTLSAIEVGGAEYEVLNFIEDIYQ